MLTKANILKFTEGHFVGKRLLSFAKVRIGSKWWQMLTLIFLKIAKNEDLIQEMSNILTLIKREFSHTIKKGILAL